MFKKTLYLCYKPICQTLQLTWGVFPLAGTVVQKEQPTEGKSWCWCPAIHPIGILRVHSSAGPVWPTDLLLVVGQHQLYIFWFSLQRNPFWVLQDCVPMWSKAW